MDKVRRAEPEVRIEVPDMPGRINASGVEFVEFAADKEEAEELGRMCHQLGFELTGRHKSKGATLWRQGGISLVVNTEREGFAHPPISFTGHQSATSA